MSPPDVSPDNFQLPSDPVLRVLTSARTAWVQTWSSLCQPAGDGGFAPPVLSDAVDVLCDAVLARLQGLPPPAGIEPGLRHALKTGAHRARVVEEVQALAAAGQSVLSDGGEADASSALRLQRAVDALVVHAATVEVHEFSDAAVDTALLAALMGMAPGGLAVADRARRWVRSNAAVAELLGAPLKDLWRGPVQDALRAQVDHVFLTGEARVDVRIGTEESTLLAAFQPIRDVEGTVRWVGLRLTRAPAGD